MQGGLYDDDPIADSIEFLQAVQTHLFVSLDITQWSCVALHGKMHLSVIFGYKLGPLEQLAVHISLIGARRRSVQRHGKNRPE